MNELRGWKKIEGLPSLDELNHFLSKRGTLDREVWESAAKCLGEFRSSREFHDGDRKLVGLNFSAESGSILIEFPVGACANPAEHSGRLYIMGETTAEAYSTVVCRLHDEIERLLLPAEAHAGDGV